ncbi:MAG TPA: Dabb family protein [Blastocatellia bacterium]|nr:Dabb family protein [Blastocatellia bacterium]
MQQESNQSNQPTGRRIRHIVLFRFKSETPQSDRESFLEMLRAMPQRISEIKSFEAGFDLVRAPRSFDLALVTSYEDLAALDRYAKHEHHLPVIERAKEICEQVVAADFEI